MSVEEGADFAEGFFRFGGLIVEQVMSVRLAFKDLQLRIDARLAVERLDGEERQDRRGKAGRGKAGQKEMTPGKAGQERRTGKAGQTEMTPKGARLSGIYSDAFPLGSFPSVLPFPPHAAYKERRTALVESVQNTCRDLLEIHGAGAGMHLTVTLPSGFNDAEIARQAAKDGLCLWPLSPCYMDKPRHGFVLGFAATPAVQMAGAVQRLWKLLENQPSPS